MYYVYLIRSYHSPKQQYVGYTTNFKNRLQEHNTKKSLHTSKYAPWELEVCIAFKNKEKALNFEKYLKSGSGWTFANKRFW